MNIVFFGTGPFGLPALEALVQSKHPIKAVITSKDKPSGRDLKSKPSVIKQWAQSHGLLVSDFGSVPIPQADLFIVVDFGFILTEEILGQPTRAALNVHASLLPKYRGAAPIQRALLNGEKKTGVSVIRMNARLDAGDILTQKEAVIAPDEDAVSLERRLAALGAQALMESLDALESGRAVFKPQDERQATAAAKISKNEGRLDWGEGAEKILNRVRAMAGWPGAFCFHRGKRLFILEARGVQAPKTLKPGEVILAPSRESFTIATIHDGIQPLRVQLESKKAMPVSEFLKGYPLQSGDMIE